MKHKLMLFVLCSSLAAFAQGRSGGHAGGPAAGVGAAGASGMGSMGADKSAGAGMRGSATDSHGASSDIGKKSPDQILSQNSKLSSKLDSLLPNGTTAQQACSGFKNLGQCVAAIHVAHNLGISFDDLKAKMTGSNAESLGKAIQDLDPNVNAKAEAKKGKKQAENDLDEAKS